MTSESFTDSEGPESTPRPPTPPISKDGVSQDHVPIRGEVIPTPCLPHEDAEKDPDFCSVQGDTDTGYSLSGNDDDFVDHRMMNAELKKSSRQDDHDD